MSNKLSSILQSVKEYVPNEKKDPDQRLIEALSKALENTTPERPGCPWDKKEEENERQRESGYWTPEGD